MPLHWKSLNRWFWRKRQYLQKNHPNELSADLEDITYRELRRLAETSPHLLQDIGLEDLPLEEPDPIDTGKLAARGATHLCSTSNAQPNEEPTNVQGHLTMPLRQGIRIMALGRPVIINS